MVHSTTDVHKGNSRTIDVNMSGRIVKEQLRPLAIVLARGNILIDRAEMSTSICRNAI